MSTSAPRPFLADLRRLEAELPVPVPDRIRFLRELEYDLEAFQDGLVDRGVALDEARGRALEALLPDRAALGELGRQHAPLYQRITASLDPGRLRRLERRALALVAASVVAVQGAVLLRADLLTDPSPFLAPVLVLGAILLTLCVARTFQVWVKGDGRAEGDGLGSILVLSGAVIGVAFVGVLADTYRFVVTLEADPGLAGALAVPWLIRESALLAVATLVALAGGLVWFVLAQWVSGVANARREVLGLTHPLDQESSRE
jgi:hypothetical protein